MDEHRKGRETISPLFWLVIRYRIDFKIFFLAFKAVNGLAASYLCEFLHLHVPARALGAANHLLWMCPKQGWKPGSDRSVPAPGRFKSLLKTPLLLISRCFIPTDYYSYFECYFHELTLRCSFTVIGKKSLTVLLVFLCHVFTSWSAICFKCAISMKSNWMDGWMDVLCSALGLQLHEGSKI